MKKMLSMLVVLAMLLSLAVLSVGCSDEEPNFTYDTRPTESVDPTATEGTGAAGGQDSGGGEGGGDSSGGGESTPAVMPEMAGNVVHQYYMTTEVSSSLGALETLEIYIQLYDTPNADGMVVLQASRQGSSVSYSTYDNWTENEDGTITIRVDEFSTMDTKIVDGVAYFVSIPYSGGMMGTSAYADVPEVDLSFEMPVFSTETEGTEGTEPVEGAEGTEPAGTEGAEGSEGTETQPAEGAETEPAGTEGTVPAGTEGSEGSEGTETTPA